MSYVLIYIAGVITPVALIGFYAAYVQIMEDKEDLGQGLDNG